VIRKHQQGVLITLLERILKFTFIKNKKSANNTSELVRAGVISILKNTKKHKVLTITTDNGKECSCHKQILMRLKLDFYFAHPYHS
jgi:IS30 family transposase